MGSLQGFAAQLGISASNPVDTRYQFLTVGGGLEENILDMNGLRGTRARSKEATRPNMRKVALQLEMEPNPVEMAGLLPWILGAAASGTTYALADTLPARYVSVACDDGSDGKVFTYDGCKVNQARFSCTQGGSLKLSLAVVGIDETVGNAATFPSLSLDLTTKPFILPDSTGAFTVGGTAYPLRDLEVTIDNKIDTERFLNSLTLVSVTPQDLEISVRATLPYGDSEAVYNSGSSGSAVVATFTNGTVSAAFTFAALVWGRKTPPIPGRREIMQTIEGKAYMSSTTKPLVVTLDSTP